jgi:hypothetical protein
MNNKKNPYGRILGFLDRSRYYFFQVAPQLYSRGWVDPVLDSTYEFYFVEDCYYFRTFRMQVKQIGLKERSIIHFNMQMFDQKVVICPIQNNKNDL